MPQRTHRSTVAWFAAAILISAFLVFQVQPVISKSILPWFGGSPAVWTTCMLFFQVVLFAGYAYAHVLTRWFSPRWQGFIHFALIIAALCVLPISPSQVWKPTGTEDPSLQILTILAATVGLPYFLLSSTGPLLQAWFASALPGRSPYRLYALSNVGSLLALISYPFLVEPAWTTDMQGRIWSGLFCAFGVVCAYLAIRQRRATEVDSASRDKNNSRDAAAAPPSWRDRAVWLLLPAFASIFLLAITDHVCQDIAVVPFLWVIPLSLYLATFIICFDRETWYSRRWYGGLAVLGLLIVNVGILHGTEWHLVVELTLYFATMFLVCMVCHGELVRRKPHPRYLTSFYLLTSAGGAVGGITIGIICPLVFSTHVELQLCLLAAATLSASVFLLDANETWLGDTRPRRAIAALCYFAVFLVVALAQFGQAASNVTASVRNFYGVLRLEEGGFGPELVHGRIIHGFQFRNPRLQHLPTAYYGEDSGVGIALRHYHSGQPKRVGAVGLGCGTVATYGRPGDYFRFYEINPAVAKIARERFTFLKNCRADTDVVLGDARISMEREPSQRFDILILDAFSGDSIPAHLLTKEAFDVYLRHLKTGGVIAVHISNQHLDLEPVVQRLARAIAFKCVRIDNKPTPPQTFESHWILVSSDADFLAQREIRAVGKACKSPTQFPLWTDQYNNVVQLLRIHRRD